jgi:hypothetical protein
MATYVNQKSEWKPLNKTRIEDLALEAMAAKKGQPYMAFEGGEPYPVRSEKVIMGELFKAMRLVY